MQSPNERALRDFKDVFGDRLKRGGPAPPGVPDAGDRLASVSPMSVEEVKLLAEVAGRYSVPLVARCRDGIEGAISSKSQAKEVQRIRENAKYVVAIGACACTGQPSTSRNQFVSDQLSERIRWYLRHFDYGKEVKSLGEVIQVDDMVRGCPMKVPSFFQTLDKYLDLFDIPQHG